MLKSKKMIVSCLVLTFFLVTAKAQAALYDIDPIYSSVIFKVQELTGYVSGLFQNFGGVIELSGDNSQIVSLETMVDVTSIYTRNNQRDLDLLGPELFDAVKFPRAQFSSKKIEGNKIIGDLTIKGKTKEVALDYTLSGVSQDKWNRSTISLLAKGVISRKDFNIMYNRKLDNGNVLLDDKVELEINAEGILQK